MRINFAKVVLLKIVGQERRQWKDKQYAAFLEKFVLYNFPLSSRTNENNAHACGDAKRISIRY
jgi:hypothetical protein